MNLDKLKPYAKTFVAFVGVAITIVGPEFADNDGLQRWLRIIGGLATAAGVYFVPNLDPNATHQDESVQPPEGRHVAGGGTWGSV